MSAGALRRAMPWLCLLVAGCASLRPEDAAPAKALQVDPAVAAHFPGAKALADGIDRTGERGLRDGDRLVLGVEVVLGEEVERHLLEVIVHRHKFGEDVGRVTFTSSGENKPLAVPSRMSRMLDLEFVLRHPDGTEQQRSRVEGVPEFVLDESFVPAITHTREEQPVTFVVAVLRLLHVTNMLSEDPILQSLLQQAATVPLDITLLWRRELELVPYFDKGRPSSSEQGAYELPFDLFLNDSLLVRLVATVTDPHGPAGAIGGIFALRAQDARSPEHHLRVQMLGAVRGPLSDWQRDGALAACGYVGEGVGLAFSPDGRCVAMPGSDDNVELHDLTADDPGAVIKVACQGPTKDLAFLDSETLLVATKHHVHVFDVKDLTVPRLLASHEVAEIDLCALEVVDVQTAFVGGKGYAIARWHFGDDRSAAPTRELLQEVQVESLGAISIDGSPKVVTVGPPAAMTVTMVRTPSTGWLLGVDANRVLARSHNAETEWCRTPDGTWTQHDIERVDKPFSRSRRLPGSSRGHMFERVTKGTPMVSAPAVDTIAHGAGPLSLTGKGCTRMLSRRMSFANYCHGFSADGRYYAYVAPGYRVFVDVERFLAGEK